MPRKLADGIDNPVEAQTEQIGREPTELRAALDARNKVELAQDLAQPSEAKLLAAAQAGIDEHPDHYIQAKGRAAERAALVKLESDGQVTDLNRQLGANFPIYDVASDKQVTSVKCKGLDASGLSDSARDAYIRDLEEAIGQGTNPEKFANAARHLHDATAAHGAGLPRELAASPGSAERYLRENARLAIPDDHAAAVQNELSQRLFSTDGIERKVAAQRLGLDPADSNYSDKARSLLNRIEGIGIRSTEIKNLLDRTSGVWQNA